jgi:quercetin dioxygenase-like cupin family protein
MKNGSYFILVVSFLLVNYSQATAGEVQIQSLMKTQLEGVGGTEVIVSKVTMPANTSLPKHWHPGEEFVYILEGSVTLWQKGKEDVVGNVGELIKVPLRQIHTGITGKEGATLIVFRVHEQGQPERVKAE